ncbi:Sulfite exporter TauE/SafE [Colwellia chukchiensis]|uniref:Probable membrane transporter protein n=1 Tax=Colwellia chukchiensis TaxID=641665 RepID=A0A1H7TIT9_9GAMM|nr:TSUP family transporter [Colwellia chukchiensis]SEL84409.1 Sulfite exporter TauE/SafE [Colwellia chukchiensis]
MELNEITFDASLIHYTLLLFGSFVATLTGSLLGIGGGFIILGLLSSLFPISVMIPLLAAVLACIDLNRAIAFKAHLQVTIFHSFFIGCVVGVIGGAILFVSLPEKLIGTGLGLLILLSLVKPSYRVNWTFKYPFVWVGTIHAFLSSMFGYGGLLQAVLIRKRLGNLQITATLATCFLMLELLKVSSYAIAGFDYQPYIGVIIASAFGAIPASILGKKLAHRVSHKLYRTVQKIIIILIASNILFRVWT